MSSHGPTPAWLPRDLTAALALAAVALLGVPACGGEEETDRATTAPAGGATSPSQGDDIVIRTHVVLSDISNGEPAKGSPIAEGEVLEGSTVAESVFCRNGTFTDTHGKDPDLGLVDRTIRCPRGTLRIAFTPGTAQGRIQAGPWQVVSGTGPFEGLTGSGQMDIEYEPGTRGSEGRETFTGTLTGSS